MSNAVGKLPEWPGRKSPGEAMGTLYWLDDDEHSPGLYVLTANKGKSHALIIERDDLFRLPLPDELVSAELPPVEPVKPVAIEGDGPVQWENDDGQVRFQPRLPTGESLWSIGYDRKWSVERPEDKPGFEGHWMPYLVNTEKGAVKAARIEEAARRSQNWRKSEPATE